MTIAIIGAGIAGLSHALLAARQGHQVTVFERSPSPQGASIRNFGMLWSIGQTADLYPLALRSREIWLEILAEMGAYHRLCGSLHLASREDEATVLREFADLAPALGYQVQFLSPSQVEARSPVVKKGITQAGLYSPTEVNIDPRQVAQLLPRYLQDKFGVRFRWNTRVTSIAEGSLETADRHHHPYDQILLCSGAELEALFPDLLTTSSIRLTKLQMMRTVPQGPAFDLGPMPATGLTLRHYENFRICSSQHALIDRVAHETPLLDRYGIHVMASQDATGGLVLGDSHEYGTEITPFDREEIDDLILTELRRHFEFPRWQIARRWHGIYGKIPGQPILDLPSPLPGVHLRTGLGGTGMTLSFGLAEQFVTRHLTPSPKRPPASPSPSPQWA
ncbi:TIGR03364 family FAD-dependent oxidoreductase [Roseibacillus ishigakijimensis]|uniref:TIGR03364 family FAD-dependent oxidoreductase n=1 Tax=Roseibacillus ishigakijimensis TaxID=454146 RepID=A0A934VN05_9BACT|nr:TIGR03364 family FAD-dependent oxidoreductase [Roseibacillus ishigakijimensis]MBK1834631.1 TIGR03364 family FAD-dependent oxidoreductase [Roseibacillus ishigakijimensis]